jgi:ribosomal protein S27E
VHADLLGWTRRFREAECKACLTGLSARNSSDPAAAILRLQSHGENTSVLMRVVLPGDRVTSDDRLLADRQTLSLSRWQFSRIRSRGLRRAAWGAVPLVVGALALSWMISRTAPPVDSPWRPLPFFVLITYVLAGAGIIAWLLRNPLLHCPQCSQSLAEGMAPYFAIVTGRCPKCAATIFEDDAVWIPEERAGIAGAKLLSRAELLAAESDARRSATPRTIKWGLSGALLVALGGASGALLKHVLASRLGEVWTPFVVPVLLAPGIAVGFWAVVVWDRSSAVAKLCPHCSAEITPQGFACITGNCSRCGKKAVSDPFPGMLPIVRTNEAPEWSLVKFRDLAKPCRDRRWIGCVVGAGLNCLWCAPLLMAIPADTRFENSLGGSAVYFACLAGITLCQCGGVLLWQRYSGRRIRCSACRRELVEFYELVISSRRCYHCGTTLLEPHNGEASVSNRNAAGCEC